MEFDPIQDVIANSTTLLLFFSVLHATSPSSLVFPTPRIRDKELHPYYLFLLILSFILFFMELTFWSAERPDRHMICIHYNTCTDTSAEFIFVIYTIIVLDMIKLTAYIFVVLSSTAN